MVTGENGYLVGINVIGGAPMVARQQITGVTRSKATTDLVRLGLLQDGSTEENQGNDVQVCKADERKAAIREMKRGGTKGFTGSGSGNCRALGSRQDTCTWALELTYSEMIGKVPDLKIVRKFHMLPCDLVAKEADIRSKENEIEVG